MFDRYASEGQRKPLFFDWSHYDPDLCRSAKGSAHVFTGRWWVPLTPEMPQRYLVKALEHGLTQALQRRGWLCRADADWVELTDQPDWENCRYWRHPRVAATPLVLQQLSLYLSVCHLVLRDVGKEDDNEAYHAARAVCYRVIEHGLRLESRPGFPVGQTATAAGESLLSSLMRNEVQFSGCARRYGKKAMLEQLRTMFAEARLVLPEPDCPTMSDHD